MAALAGRRRDGANMAGGNMLKAAGATATPAQIYADAQTRNALLRIPGGVPDPHTDVVGTLGNTTGGRQVDPTKPDRVSVYLGPRATLRGVVSDLLRRTLPLPEPVATLDEELLSAQGVFVYNLDYLDALGPGAWRVGLWLPLPVEVDGTTWTNDWETVRAWAADFPTDRFAELDTPAAALPIPDPDLLPGEVAPVLTGTADAIATDLADQLVTNPFDAVFRAYEIFRGLPAAGATSAQVIAQKLVEAISARELTLLASVTAGNAVLRRMWTALETSAEPGADDAREWVATSLGLHLDAPSGTWSGPLVVGPTAVPDELPREVVVPTKKPVFPKRATQKVERPDEDPNGYHRLVLGRDLCVGDIASHTQRNGRSWAGPAYTGRVLPGRWAAAHAALLRITGTVELARQEVVLKIAENEAFLDGSRAADKGMLSSGIQQWSIHLNDELPPLLERFRVAAPDHYDLFFGLYGLQSRLWARTGDEPGDLEAPPTPPDADIRRDNADAFTGTTPETDAKAFDATYATVGHLPPGGAWQHLPEPPSTVTAVGPRHAYFGVTQAGTSFAVDSTWVGRVRLAALCSTEYRLCQVWHGIYRFERLLRSIGTIAVDGVDHTAPELLPSQFAAAAALDEHINAPWQVDDHLVAAIARTFAATAAHPDAAVREEMRPHEDDGSTLRVPFLHALAVNYLAVRTPEGKEHRDATLVKLHDLGLDTTPPPGLASLPGTFAGW
jgi:hypothetical protein